MTTVNDWRRERPAPLFYLGRSSGHHEIRFHQQVPHPLRDRILKLVKNEANDRDMPVQLDQYLDTLKAVSPDLVVWLGPAYCFSELSQPDAPQIQLVTQENAQILEAQMDDWLADVDHEQPMVAWLESGSAVGVCARVRQSDGAMVAGIEVVPSARRRGIGEQLAKTWAAEVMALGKIAMYSTSSDNTASKGLANRLGLRFLGTDFHISASSSGAPID